MMVVVVMRINEPNLVVLAWFLSLLWLALVP